MGFLATPFPELISFGASGGPEFNTDVVIFGGGDESRNQNWSQARLKWEVSHAARMPTEYRKLTSHFRLAGGRANSFPFKDWSDYAVISGEGVLTTVTGGKQLTKRYTIGSNTVDRLIYLPKAGTVTLTGGGSLNYSTGLVTGGSPTSWVGEFYVPARYDIDEMRGQIIDRSGNDLIMAWESIPIIETRDYQ